MNIIDSPVLTILVALAVCAVDLDVIAPKRDGKHPASESAQPGKDSSGLRSDMSSGKALTLAELPGRYQFLLNEAMMRFQVRDFKGALGYVDRADEILPPTASSLNVRGAIAIEQRDFERGNKYCTEALKLDPDFLAAKFNLCEIPFLQGKYAEARRLWTPLLSLTKAGDASWELLIYRIYLTYLLEKDFDQAKEWLDKLPFPSQSPAYQYAHAAWAYQKGDLAKWDEWTSSAAFIWPESNRGEFMDVLIQLGWMKKESVRVRGD